MKYNLFFLVVILFLSLTSISAFNFESIGGTSTVTVTTGNATNFTQLLDVPNSYTGETGKCVIVNAGENGLTFDSCAAAGDTDTWNTTAQIWYVINNGTFMKISTKVGNTTSEIWGIVNNNTWMPIGTQTGNTTLEMITAINTSNYYQIKVNYSNVLNHPSMSDTDTFNTTSEMWTVANNGTFMPLSVKTGNTTSEMWIIVDNNTFLKVESDPLFSANFTNMKIDCPTGNYSYGIFSNGTLKCRGDTSVAGGGTYLGYYNSSLINTTQMEEQAGTILGIKWGWLSSLFHSINTKVGNTTAEIKAIDTSNTTSEMWTVINNGTWGKGGGNTTSEMWTIINNATFFELSNKSKITWSIINNETFMKVGTGNTTSQMITAINNTVGIFNITSNVSTFFNGTIGMNMTQHLTTGGGVISILQSWLKTWADTIYVPLTTMLGNTTSQMWAVINNGTWMPQSTKVGNTTAEIKAIDTFNTTSEMWTVANNNTFRGLTNTTFTLNVTMSGSAVTCYSNSSHPCASYIYNNGSGLVIKTT